MNVLEKKLHHQVRKFHLQSTCILIFPRHVQHPLTQMCNHVLAFIIGNCQACVDFFQIVVESPGLCRRVKRVYITDQLQLSVLQQCEAHGWEVQIHAESVNAEGM